MSLSALAIGTSAGGINALQRLLPALAGLQRSCVLVVQHMYRHTRVPIHQIFAPVPGLHLCEAEDKQALQVGGVYFAPPNYHLLVESDHTLSLDVDCPVNWARPSIDVLFESAARVFGRRCTAVLLTGANDDGAQGCREIQDHGGTVIVQDPADAEIDAMPKAALAACRPDHVMKLDAIADWLRQRIMEGDL